MTSHSHIGEDLWVVEVLKGRRNGLFLDVGCDRPFEFNNTWLLESRFDWSGLSIDRNDALAIQWVRSERKSPFICADVHLLDWKSVARSFTPRFDYLSLDVDEYQLEFVSKFPWELVRFDVMTVEHDSYRFGPERRDAIRAILEANGYAIAVKDVPCVLGPCEDWWIVR